MPTVGRVHHRPRSRTGPAAPTGDPRDRETRTVLARLLSLYEVALRHGDEPVIGLVANLRR
ncbi:hypothetical protein ACFV0W_00345 [Streptomyces anulatus]